MTMYIFIINAYYHMSTLTKFYDLKDKCILTIYSKEFEVKGSCDNYFKNNIKYISGE